MREPCQVPGGSRGACGSDEAEDAGAKTAGAAAAIGRLVVARQRCLGRAPAAGILVGELAR